MTKNRKRLSLPPLSTEQALLVEQFLEQLLLAIDKNHGDDIAELEAHLLAKHPPPGAASPSTDDLDDIF